LVRNWAVTERIEKERKSHARICTNGAAWSSLIVGLSRLMLENKGMPVRALL
jgi:hypothetical protein